ncbi:MAG: NTP transferase domain-containing protein [Desulfurococcales archaeon]|nr:NTP transferase domain-containing protein [Desulfurococcales archaeon]
MSKKAIILAAGKGERLRPLTSTRPKPSIPIGGEPIICKHIRALSSIADSIVIVVSYMKEKLVETVELCKEYSLNPSSILIKFVDQPQELGTGHAVKVGLQEVIKDSKTEEIIIAYGDVYLPHDMYIDFLEEEGEILTSVVDDPWNYGVLLIEDGLVKKVIEKPPRGEEPSNMVFSGLLKMSMKDTYILDRLKLSPRGEYELTDAIEGIGLERGLKPFTLDKGLWMDIGRPWDLLEANSRAVTECVEHNCWNSANHKLRESDNGEVFISHKKSVIERNSTVYGPAIVEAYARLKPYAFIRDFTFLYRKAVAGAHTEIKNSMLLENAKVPHQSYIGDSIIGEYSNLGASTQTANLRFDDKPVKMTVKDRRISTGRRKMGAVIGGYVKTGIGVLIYPGVKIGAYSRIYPGCIVSRDIPDKTVMKCNSGW